MKLTIDVNKDLMRRARRLTGLRTRREVVQRALRTLVQLKEQERIRRYRGKLPSDRRRDAEIRKLQRADPKLSPRQLLKPRQRVIGVQEGRVSADRLMKANRELFRRLAKTSRGEPTCAGLAGELVGSFRGGPPDASTNKRYLEEALLVDHLKHAARSTIKRTIKDYRKTLRRLASGPRRTRKA